MGIFQIIFFILILGLVVGLIQAYAPIPAIFKTIILWLAVVVIVFLILSGLGFIHDVRLPSFR
jgi:hypothetical protein